MTPPAPDKIPALPWRDRLLALWKRRGWRGYLTLTRHLKPSKGHEELRTVTRYGSQFYLHPGDVVDRHVILEGFYESEVLEAIRPALHAGSVLWVVGANFGLHAVTAKYLHPHCRVIAFEPLPAMSSRLAEHCTLNGVNVELHAYALSDRTGALPFYAAASGNPGMSTLHPVARCSYDQRFTVATYAAAEVIDRGLAPPPTAMIVDVEGAETEVLRGLGRHLTDPTLTHVVFEAENEILAQGARHPLLHLLREAGFSVTRLQRNEATAHGCSNFLATRATP
jgi:FkbM family methyltransferase